MTTNNTIDYTKLTRDEILEFTQTLSTRDPFKFTNRDLRLISEYINADGCTGVPDFYVCSCIVHDFYYATHRDFKGNIISKLEADRTFKKLIQHKSFWGKFSPMSYWRYLGVRLFGGKAWEDIK